MGLYWRGRKNAEQIQVRHIHISMKTLPSRFDGFPLLQISDLHVDMNEGAMRRLTELLPDLTYDVCVLTGDYRGAAFGPSTPRSMASRGYARISRIQSTACWEIMTPSEWFPDLKKWELGCCSTNASTFCAAIRQFI